jgi:hypothetical protein
MPEIMHKEKEDLLELDSQIVIEYIRATIEILMKMKLEDASS